MLVCGYYYDTETNLYYLQSRYYDAETGRFINADDSNILLISADSVLGINLFGYCFNNPVMMVDDEGLRPKYWINWQVAASDWCIISSPKDKIDFNCYGFAIGIYSGYKYLNPGFKTGRNIYNKYVSVDEIASRVKADLQMLCKFGKIVSGPYYKCAKNEYLIAMRVTPRSSSYYDYHFMRKGSDGIWRFKGGWSNWIFELKSGQTPSTVSWDSYGTKSTGMLLWKKTSYVVYQSNVYTSKIIYMAVKY